MTEPPALLVEAWRAAAEDLGVDVQAPYVIGDTLFAARVSGFGRQGGTLVDWIGSGNSPALVGERFYVSCVDPQAYGLYERTLFQDTLNDWGWSLDPAFAPDWYTGKPWTG